MRPPYLYAPYSFYLIVISRRQKSEIVRGFTRTSSVDYVLNQGRSCKILENLRKHRALKPDTTTNQIYMSSSGFIFYCYQEHPHSLLRLIGLARANHPSGSQTCIPLYFTTELYLSQPLLSIYLPAHGRQKDLSNVKYVTLPAILLSLQTPIPALAVSGDYETLNVRSSQSNLNLQD